MSRHAATDDTDAFLGEQYPVDDRAFVRLTEGGAAIDDSSAARIEPLRHGVKPPPRTATTRPVRRTRFRRRTMSYALTTAALLAVIGGGAGWSWLQAQPVFAQTYTTQRGEQRSVTLPDGSTLQLDTATTAAVSLSRGRRAVRLVDGQAMFTVTPDAARPFDVDAGPVRATVVGTRFSVRYTDTGLDAGGVTVAVAEGRVDVRSLMPGADGRPQPTFALAAGQAVRSDASGRMDAPRSVPANGAMPWQEGRVNLDDVPLSQALAEFARYGDTGLRLAPAIADVRISGSFELRRADAFARALPDVLPVKLRTRGGATDIEPAN
jgi:transmembrane sensor